MGARSAAGSIPLSPPRQGTELGSSTPDSPHPCSWWLKDLQKCLII